MTDMGLMSAVTALLEVRPVCATDAVPSPVRTTVLVQQLI